MTKNEYDELIGMYIDNIKKFIVDAGGLFPHITIFADKIDREGDEKKSLIHIPIPDPYMDSDAEKDSLVDEILPFIYEKIKEQFIPYGVAWASEAWMRTVTEKQLVNYKDLPPQKEVLVISIDTDYKCETIVFEIIRDGHSVNTDGEFIDKISLEKIHQSDEVESSGRFVGLYQKLKL